MDSAEAIAGTPALDGVRVLDVATLIAGPLLCTALRRFRGGGDQDRTPPRRPRARTRPGQRRRPAVVEGARTEQARGDALPRLARGQELFLRLVADADVVVESFRPGTLERWGLGYERLREANPRVILARVSGFGQHGPYAPRAGFGTIAEAMSGFAAITGEADGPPALPPFGLADGIAALVGASAVLLALHHRDACGGRGQVLDLAIIEPILTVLGTQSTIHDQLGVVQQRTGNRSANNAPRNTYRTGDGKWVAVSTSTASVAERVLRLVGHPEVIDEPWFLRCPRGATCSRPGTMQSFLSACSPQGRTPSPRTPRTPSRPRRRIGRERWWPPLSPPARRTPHLTTFVRMNGLESGRCHDDVAAVLCPRLSGITLPKVESAAEVASWLPAGVALHCTIETARGVLEAPAIAAADPHVRALVSGAADFAHDIGVSPTRWGRESLTARSLVVLASRVAGISAPVDSAYLWLDDEEGLRECAREARALGFGGKSALHPRQLAAIHEAFGAPANEVEEARRIVAAFEAARSAGRGVARLANGTFVDKAIAERARLVLARVEEGL